MKRLLKLHGLSPEVTADQSVELSDPLITTKRLLKLHGLNPEVNADQSVKLSDPRKNYEAIT